jgi:hypothetical protein
MHVTQFTALQANVEAVLALRFDDFLDDMFKLLCNVRESGEWHAGETAEMMNNAYDEDIEALGMDEDDELTDEQSMLLGRKQLEDAEDAYEDDAERGLQLLADAINARIAYVRTR